MSIDAREILRRLVLSSSNDYSDSIPEILKAIVDDLHISWAHVDGRTLSVYCYSKRDGQKIEREFGGHTVKSINPRDDDYWLWQWEAPYR